MRIIEVLVRYKPQIPFEKIDAIKAVDRNFHTSKNDENILRLGMNLNKIPI
jgi:hypothetical protein